MSPTPSNLVLMYAPWSTSKIETAIQCPKKFGLAYASKPKLPTTGNSDALVGKAAHYILEKITQGVPLPVAYAEAIQKFSLTSVETSRVDELKPYLDNFLHKFESWCTRHAAKERITELKLAVDQKGNPISYFDKHVFFRGVLDLVVLLENAPHAVVIDHKTGKPRDMSHYARQLENYVLLLKSHYLRLTGFVTAINFLQIDQVVFQPLREVDAIGTLMDPLIAYLNKSTENLTDLEKTNVGPLCGWCDYRQHCPARGQDGNAEK